MKKPRLLLFVTGQVRTIARPEVFKNAFSNFDVVTVCSTWLNVGKKQFGACNPSIVQQVFGPFFPLFIPDVYWSENGIASFLSGYTSQQTEMIDLAALHKSFACSSYDIQDEQSVDFSSFKSDFPGSLRLFYKIQRAVRAFDPALLAKFDFVGRVRPDVEFKEPIPVLPESFVCDGYKESFIGDNLMLLPMKNHEFFSSIFNRYLDSGCQYVHKFLFDEVSRTNLTIHSTDQRTIGRQSHIPEFYSHVFSEYCPEAFMPIRDVLSKLYKFPDLQSVAESGLVTELSRLAKDNIGISYLMQHITGNSAFVERSLARLPKGRAARLSKAYEKIDMDLVFDRWKKNKIVANHFRKMNLSGE